MGGTPKKYCKNCIHWKGSKCRAGYPTPKGEFSEACDKYERKD